MGRKKRSGDSKAKQKEQSLANKSPSACVAEESQLSPRAEAKLKNQSPKSDRHTSTPHKTVKEQSSSSAKQKEQSLANKSPSACVAEESQLSPRAEAKLKNQSPKSDRHTSTPHKTVKEQSSSSAKQKEQSLANKSPSACVAEESQLSPRAEAKLKNQSPKSDRHSSTPHKTVKEQSSSSEMGQSFTTLNSRGILSPTCSVVDKSEDGHIFYSVYIPSHYEHAKGKDLPVFTDKAEALRVLKQNKKARLKAFVYEADALQFSRCGEIKLVPEGGSNHEKIFYKGPKSQDLVRFRKAIESGDLHTVQKMIDENPRYLIGSGDTPSILQEGSRYNALHVGAKNFSANMCSYILSTISNVDFTKRLYGDINTNHEERINMLLDLYLNMPDKGCNETPLHFASKLGALEVVKILVRYPQCDKNKRNKEGLTAAEIACTRAPDYLIGNQNEIIRALGTLYYVPILRSEDNALQPSVGDPFTPTNPPSISSPNKAIPSLEIRALAGPMTEAEAKIFRKMWKTPPRKSVDFYTYRPELCDPDKGLEKLGRKLALEFHVNWKEYWSFLDNFVDLTSEEGLNELENHIKKQFKEEYEARNARYALLQATNSRENQLNEEVEKHGSREGATYQTTGNEEYDPIELTLRTESPMFFEGYHHVYRRKKKAIIFVTNAVEQTCKLYACRIAPALYQKNKLHAIFEISCLELFMARCSIDVRFADIDFSKSHYRLSALLKDTILTVPVNRGPAIELLGNLMSSTDLEELSKHESMKVSHEILKAAVICIARFTIALLSCVSVDSMSPRAHSDVLWNTAEVCSCPIPSQKVTRRFPSSNLSPRALFSGDDNLRGSQEDFLPFRRSSTSSGSSSGSSEDFYTAPNSPLEDETLTGEIMVMSEPGPDIFLTGTVPTKLDKAVLEAIESLDISPFKYPYINMWKQSCAQKSKYLPIERWPTPKRIFRSFK